MAVAGIDTMQCGDTSCLTPNLSIGQAVCGDGIYILRVGETTGAQITAPPGTSYADGVWIIPDVAIFPLELVASNSSGCLAAVGINSAPDCTGNGCENPLVSLTAGECIDNETYSLGFSLAQVPDDVVLSISDTNGDPIEGASIDFATERINNVPRETGLRVTATSQSCGTATVVDVSSCASLCPTNAPSLNAVQEPTCASPTGGIIEVTAPLGPAFEYSINGTDFQTETLFTDLAAGTYTLTARSTAESECTSPSTTIVLEQPILSDGTPCNLIPTGFSPNNDGNNDTFKIAILATGEYPDFNIEIFDRWGNQVYQYQNNGQIGNAIPWWDGYSMGKRTFGQNKKVPVGTYYYIIHFNTADLEPRTGWVYVSY
ncbi:MAG: gliding motility-associated C-terminal domain-containing protein [Cyanobacteria bacterium J06638_22]